MLFRGDKGDRFSMTERQWLIGVWVVLLTLTLLSALIAESADPAIWTVLFISMTVTLKGQLVIDRLMGLRHANPLIRRLMLLYFYVLAILIVLALLFPEFVARITTL
ncbi:hypothetical protein imdm_62 [gamma proteobacterium IMCC2047]|nr:hypothetical protein imdm_62 [gamma proteobacterium IMCC2047]